MKKIKNLIAILIIMFIICIVVIISIESKHNTENEVVDEAYDEIYKEKYENKLEIKKVTSRSDFVSIENCISSFLGALSNKNNQYVYSLLDTKYINNNDININNVLEKVRINNDTPGFVAEEIYTQILDKIIIYKDNIIEIFIKYLPMSITLKYSTTGRLSNYKICFEPTDI